MNDLVGVLSEFIGLKYFQSKEEVNNNDLIVVSTPFIDYITKVHKIRPVQEHELSNEDFDSFFPNIIRKANKEDEITFKENEKLTKEITKFTQEESNKLNLEMKVLNSYIDINKEKLLITFVAEGRVDFRELIKIITSKYHLRIELRQVGSRDVAKTIGGIGPCGLPLCCSTFIREFDVISLSMAKNQLLAPTIPKLSGQCGKLFCCLKFEDDAYTQVTKEFPKIGFEFTYKSKQYKVASLNVLTGIITCSSENTFETFTKEEFDRVKEGKEKSVSVPLRSDINEGVDLSGKGMDETSRRFDEVKAEEKRMQDNMSNINSNNRHNHKFNKHKFNKFNKHNRFNNHNSFNNRNQNNNKSSDSGFIKVSSIEDRSILDIKPNKDNNEDK